MATNLFHKDKEIQFIQYYSDCRVMPPPLQSEQELCTMRQTVAQHMQRIVANCFIIITVLFAIMLTSTDPEPYHILTLLGEMWVDELFN